MEKNLKQLLLRDLCARLPYGVIGWAGRNEILTNISEKGFYQNRSRDGWHPIEDFIPYLRPISSMTKEEIDNLFKILKIKEDSDSSEWLKINDTGIIRLYTEEGKDFYEIAEAMDYLNSIHIDYLGLIEKGLALEAPKDMYNNQ